MGISNVLKDNKKKMIKITNGNENNPKDNPDLSKIYMIEIDKKQIEEVRRVCTEELGYPLLEEYDFINDTDTHDLPISLKPSTSVRPYQEKCLSKMFGNGRASGMIVLPCGAGKTLVGITAAQTIKKSTIVFCTSVMAVEQWRNQFKLWTNIPDKYIYKFTRNTVGQKFNTDCLIMITTYAMFAAGGIRSAKSREVIEYIKNHEFGLLLLDEVQVAPAATFRKVMSEINSRSKLGLTATLVREDEKITELFYLIGPKLYEANWLDLQSAGYIATVQCVQVWCPMTAEFYQDYLQASQSKNRQRLLYVNNPNKFRACQYLMEIHEKRGDKVLIFSDVRFTLEHYARNLSRPLIHGDTSNEERLLFLKRFQNDPDMNTLCISKIGDNSIDLPDVNVIIQISSHFSSRRQEAQRLGRILRPKKKSTGRFNAFYTLISTDTFEVKYAIKRQRFLVDQGYAFKIVKNMMEFASQDQQIYQKLKYQTKKEQLQLLNRIRGTNEIVGAIDHDDDDDVAQGAQTTTNNNILGTELDGLLNNNTNMNILTGANHGIYSEFNKNEIETDEQIPLHYEPAFCS